MQETVDSLSFGNVFLDAFFLPIERDAARTGTHVAVVGIGHLARSVDDAAHDADLQSHEMSSGCLDAADGVLQVVERAAAARTGDVLRLGEFDAGGLENGVGEGCEVFWSN